MAELSSDAATPTGGANTPIPRASRHGVVIVAEDDRELRALVSNVLAYDGFTIKEVANGVELTEAVRKMDPASDPLELIVTDIDMPSLDGLTAIEYLGGTELGIPVVVITAFASDDARLRATRVGAAAVLSKPFELDELRAVAEQLTLHSGAHDALW